MSYFYVLDNSTLDEMEVIRQLNRIRCNDDRCEFSLRELSSKCDPRIKMNKDKLSKILHSLHDKGVIMITERKGNKTVIYITTKNMISNSINNK